MPTRINAYICNLCGEKYESHLEAEKCESYHLKLGEIVGVEYKGLRSRHPASFDVAFKSQGKTEVISYYKG